MKFKDQGTRISWVRSKLVLTPEFSWFGNLSMRLQIVEENRLPTMAVDGTRMFYNSEFVKTLTDDELKFVVAHETLHVALRHMYRIGHREHRRWNFATDYAINLLLVQAGFTPPKDCLYDKKYDNMTAEAIYKKIPDPPPEYCKCSTGSFSAPPGPGDKGYDPNDLTEADWEIATEQETQRAQKAGNLPGGLERVVKVANKTDTDWRAILRRFIENTIPIDQSWAVPNRKFIGQGLYFPGLRKENMPRIAVAIDTSGSINQHLLNLFGAELTTILNDLRPECLDVIYCDTKVQAREQFTPDDQQVVLKMPGGGGTSFQPVFDLLNKETEQPPTALIYMTDLEGPDAREPEYPTLWITTDSCTLTAPFGETIRVNEYAEKR